MRSLLSLLIAIFLMMSFGCATASQQEIDEAYFQPVPTSHRADIERLMSRRLKDPDSAIYEFLQPRRAIFQDGIFRGASKYFAYVVPTYINAKNSFGGYAGSELFYFAFYDFAVHDVTANFKLGNANFIDE